jgi:hypothetical protein
VGLSVYAYRLMPPATLAGRSEDSGKARGYLCEKTENVFLLGSDTGVVGSATVKTFEFILDCWKACTIHGLELCSGR